MKLLTPIVAAGLLLLPQAAQARKCTYALAPSSISVPSTASSSTLTMTAGTGCAWSAATTNSWIHVVGSGSANGTINYSVDANLGANSRVGSITAGGVTTVLTQGAAPISLGIALDNTNLVWQTSSTYPWLGTNPPSPTFDGVYSAVSGNRFVPSSSSWLQTTVVGPGTLSFWWRVDSDVTPPPPATPYSFDALEVDINGVMQDQIMGQVDWNYRSYALPAGTNVITWQYVKDATYNAGADQAWLDQVHFVTAAPIALSTALDTCGANWTSGGNTNVTYWTGQTNVTRDGAAAAQSGAIAPGQESWLQTTVAGVTNLSFWWKVSSQTNYDYLEFYTNSVLATRISGEADWRSNYFRLSSATNQLKWRYVRTNIVVTSQGQSCGWLDGVSLTPSPKPQILSYPTNLVLSTSATNCQALLPDLTTSVTLADNCSSAIVTQTPPPGTVLALGTTRVVLTASAPSGATQVTNAILVVDGAPPLLNLLGANPLTNECHAAFVDPGATATDNCSGVLSLVTNNSVNPNLPGAYLIQYLATDANGNAATNSRTVYVVDTTPPQITLNGANPLIVECHGPFADPGVSAVDACAGSVSVSVTGTVDPSTPGSYALVYSAQDPSGNADTLIRTVQVVDTTPPQITLNGANPLVVECHGAFTDPGASATDVCAGAVSVSVSGTVDPNTPGNYALVYSAHDPAGNAATVTRTVQVADTTPPQIAMNGANPLTSECHGPFVDPGATAFDTCSGALSVVTNSSVNPNAVGVYRIDYVATDSSGNQATNSRTVFIVDTTPPQFAQSASTPTLAATTNCMAILPDLTSLLGATDNCSASLNFLQIPPAGTLLPLGTTNVTFLVDDGNGNTNTANMLVTVADQALPVIAGEPQSQTNGVGAEVQFRLSATACSSLSYQWFSDKGLLAGQTNAALTLGSVSLADAGSYYALVSSSAGSVTSLVAQLTVTNLVLVAPTLLALQPVAQGGFQLSFSGPSGQTYRVLTAEDFTAPMASWTVLTNGTFTADPVTLVDPAAGVPQRFYRIASP
jgi:hypothetical protein